MPLINYVKVYGSDVAKVLEPGERLLDMYLYREPLIGDDSRLGRTPDEVSPRMRRIVEKHGPVPPAPDRLIEGFDPLAGIMVNPDRMNRLFGGVTGIGGPESVAGRIWRVAKAHEDHLDYAVTDRRLLLLATTSPTAADYRIVFEVPRGAVASARRRGKLLFQWGRVEVRFADGSMKAWTPGMLSFGRARSLVATLTGAP